MKKRRRLVKNLREHPRGSGRYEYSFRNSKRTPNPKVIRFGAEDDDEANMTALSYKADYDNGTYDPWLDIKDDIYHAAKKYIDASKDLRPNTIRGRRSCLDLFLDHAQAKSFQFVTHEVVAGFLAKFPNAATKRTRLQIIGQFFRWCISNGYTRSNPAKEYMDRRASKPKEKRRREELTLDEYRRIYGEAMQLVMHCDPWWEEYLEIDICTGMRRDELSFLNLRNVVTDGITGRVEIDEWINPRTGEHFVPKNENAKRIIPLVPRAAAIFKRRIGMLATDDPWAPIFPPTPKQKFRIRQDAPSKAFRKCRDRAGFGSSKTLHSCRHSFTSWLIALGVDPYTVLEVLGHKTIRSQERYVHFCKKLLGRGAAKVKRELVAFFCPGVDEDILKFVFPDSRSFTFNPMSLASRLDILDILFGGALYDQSFIEHVRREAMTGNLARN